MGHFECCIPVGNYFFGIPLLAQVKLEEGTRCLLQGNAAMKSTRPCYKHSSGSMPRGSGDDQILRVEKPCVPPYPQGAKCSVCGPEPFNTSTTRTLCAKALLSCFCFQRLIVTEDCGMMNMPLDGHRDTEPLSSRTVCPRVMGPWDQTQGKHALRFIHTTGIYNF